MENILKLKTTCTVLIKQWPCAQSTKLHCILKRWKKRDIRNFSLLIFTLVLENFDIRVTNRVHLQRGNHQVIQKSYFKVNKGKPRRYIHIKRWNIHHTRYRLFCLHRDSIRPNSKMDLSPKRLYRDLPLKQRQRWLMKRHTQPKRGEYLILIFDS